ncbi:hypothetical protein ACGFX4_37835 [Kitasatospora sp. NPDC048365]|uniref:hypothetical protein n=1 Tax=Kitasatospora sp. NPDC048365 TaxID=3364050 RepID=UPI003716E128
MATRTKTRTTAPTTMIVDATQVSSWSGCLTLRCGPVLRHVASACVALPVNGFPDLPARLRTLALAAEPEYRPLAHQVFSTVPSGNPLALIQAMQRHLRGQDWDSAAAAAPDSELLLFHHSGHVVLQARAPFSRRPVRLILDPLQLLRLHATLEAAAADARRQHDAHPALPRDQRARTALAHLRHAPWAPHDTPDPTPEHVEEVMGRLQEDFLRRVPYQRSRTDENTAPPTDTHWTPLLHPCGCTTSWGWDKREMDPAMFMDFCLRAFPSPCPLHIDRGSAAPAVQPQHVQCPATNRRVWTRPATGDSIPLGAELARQLTTLTATVAETDPTELAARLPQQWHDAVAQSGDDPVRAWIEQRLLDILLNHGGDTIASITDALNTVASRPRTENEAGDRCQTCATAHAAGGLLCECGHDRTCHPGKPANSEPCSHCSADMRMADPTSM